MKTRSFFKFALVCATVAMTAMAFTACDKGDDEPTPEPKEYTVTITAGENGKASADKTKAGAGATVTLTVTPDAGYVFETWTVTAGGATLSSASSASATFKMPEANVSLAASFIAAPMPIVIPEEEKTQTAFADEQTTGELTFTATAAWSIDVSEAAKTRAGSDVAWIRLYIDGVETYSGEAGEIVLEIVVDPNYSGEDREAEMVITSAGEEVSVSVTQSATTEAGEVPEDPEDPDSNGYAELLTAHVWHHVLTTDNEMPEDVDKSYYTMTFHEDGTVDQSEMADNDEWGFTGVPYSLKGSTLLMGSEGEQETITIVDLTDDKLVLDDGYGIVYFSKNKLENPVEPEPSDNLALLTAHAWKHVGTTHKDEYDTGATDTEIYADDYMLTFKADGSMTATGTGSDIFTDYFGSSPAPTYSIADGKLTMNLKDENNMFEHSGPLPFDIVRLSDNELQFTVSGDGGYSNMNSDGTTTDGTLVTTITMSFVKQ